MKQFFYTRREPVAPKEGETEIKFVDYRDSFNLEKVVRTFEYETGKIAVLLDDGHEESIVREPALKDSKGKVMRQEVRERAWMVSQIYLNEEDTKRFWEIR